MKRSIQLLVGSLLAVTLTACGGSGGGSSSSSPSGPGGVAGALGTSGYFPSGTWTGSLVVQNPGQYAIMSNSFGLCQGIPGGCNTNVTNVTSYFQLQIQVPTSDNNMLPGNVALAIQPNVNGYPTQSLSSSTAQGFINASNNGMLINYYGQYGQQGYGQQTQCYPGYPCTSPYQPNGTPPLQIVTQYTDAVNGPHTVMNVQVLFNGQQIANGTVQGGSLYPGSSTIYSPTQYGTTQYYPQSYPYQTYQYPVYFNH